MRVKDRSRTSGHRVGGRMSDENKGKPSKSVMGNLPSTRPTRMARRRDGEPAANGTARPAGRRRARRRSPKAEGEAAAKATPATAEGRRRSRRRQPRGRSRRPPPRRRRRPEPRAVRSGSPSLDAAKKPSRTRAPRAGRRRRPRAPSSSPRRSRRPASWPRSASPSAARRSSAPWTACRSRSYRLARRAPRARFPRAESPRTHRGERGTQCGLRATGANRTYQTSVALLSLREPVSSPRRHRRKHR